MKIPFGYRFLLTSIISYGLALFWVITTFPYRQEGNIVSEFSLIFANIAYNWIIVMILIGIVLFLSRNSLSQIKLPIALPRLKEKTEIFFPILFFVLPSFIIIALIIRYILWPYVQNSTDLIVSFESVVNNGTTIFPSRLIEVGKSLVFYFVAPLAIAFIPPKISKARQRLNENKTFRQLFLEGRGGSARWASIASYEKRKHPLYALDALGLNEDDKGQITDSIILGKSLFDDDPTPRTIGITDDAHMLTIGMTGSGKSTTVLLPNLAMYKGSAANSGANRASHIGQSVPLVSEQSVPFISEQTVPHELADFDFKNRINFSFC